MPASGKTSERGYGVEHQKAREALLAEAIGQDCAYCGQVMKLGQALDLDHSEPELKAAGVPGDRITHAKCNRVAGTERQAGPIYSVAVEQVLTEWVEASVAAMPWLTDADQGAVQLARTYAAAIDAAASTGEAPALQKALYLGPHLVNTLNLLGGTPTGRKALELREEARGKLAAVRDLRARSAPSKKRTSTSA